MELVISLIFSTLRQTAPLLLTALGGLFSERSGVTNIALEGMILFSTAAAAISVERIEHATGREVMFWIPWVGLLIGALVGGLSALVHAVVSIKYRGDQIVSGAALNFLALGAPSIVLQVFYNNTSTSNEVVNRIKNLSLLGEDISWVVLFAFLLVPLVWWVLFKSPWGLRLRAVGEHPEAAETMGVNVLRMRYMAVIHSSVLAGIAGGISSVWVG